MLKLRQVEVLQGQGKSIADAVRQIGVTQQPYYRWRKEYGGMSRDQLKRLKELVNCFAIDLDPALPVQTHTPFRFMFFMHGSRTVHWSVSGKLTPDFVKKQMEHFIMQSILDHLRPRRRAHDLHLIARLAMTRPMTSLIERDLLGATAQMQRDHSDWVRMWVDPNHRVTGDCGKITAWRGITREGELLWLVHHETKRRGYHSRHTCPFSAIEEAQHAWRERRRVRERWPEVKSLAKDLFLGRQKLDVQLRDAHASALCTVGVESFLGRIGLGRWQRCSGRTAAILMLIEPQVGFVLSAAHERVNGRSGIKPMGEAAPVSTANTAAIEFGR